jgi:hypothetical protein
MQAGQPFSQNLNELNNGDEYAPFAFVATNPLSRGRVVYLPQFSAPIAANEFSDLAAIQQPPCPGGHWFGRLPWLRNFVVAVTGRHPRFSLRF